MALQLSKELMGVRTAYLGLFFTNAIFATLFKSSGEGECSRLPSRQ